MQIYFDGVTHAHSLSIQLAREKRRNDALIDELKSAKRELRALNDRRHDSKNKLTRDINTQQHEISSLSGKIMDLELELKKSTQEKVRTSRYQTKQQSSGDMTEPLLPNNTLTQQRNPRSARCR
jgi:hypothetical protein